VTVEPPRCSLEHIVWLWNPLSLLWSGHQLFLPPVKAIGAWRWALNAVQCCCPICCSSIQINQPTRCNSFTNLLLDVLCRSTCFGRLHAHHQELTAALTASAFTVGTLVVAVLLLKMSSNKIVKLLHLVGWFIWIVWWCADLATSNAVLH